MLVLSLRLIAGLKSWLKAAKLNRRKGKRIEQDNKGFVLFGESM